MRQTLREPSRYQADPVKGSRFIADLAPVTSELEARALLEAIRAEFPDASHHCSAWRIASPAIERANDDGEPGGSAGRPILGQLTGRDLVDVAVVVTRWFGGTKLGVGGLVRAYGGTAGEALEIATLHPWVVVTTVSFSHGYGYTDAIGRAVASLEGAYVERKFEEQVHSRVQLPGEKLIEFTRLLADVTGGAFEIHE